MGAWSKYVLGWVKTIHITSSGTYTLHPWCMSNTVYRIDYNMPPGKYFLIEYRYPCGFDADLKSSSSDRGKDCHGTAIWHIDKADLQGMQAQKDPFGNDVPIINYQTNAYPGNGVWPAKHYRVALVQADGNWDLE